MMTPAHHHAESFVCPRFHGSITREACAARHRHFAAQRATSREPVTGCVCKTCPLGQAHAAGDRPDVTLVQLTPCSTSAPRPRRARLCLGCGQPLRPRGKSPAARAGSTHRSVCGVACAALHAEHARATQRHQLPEWA